jgi:hypothetical protein
MMMMMMMMIIPISDGNCVHCAQLVMFLAVLYGGSLFILCIYILCAASMSLISINS